MKLSENPGEKEEVAEEYQFTEQGSPGTVQRLMNG